MPLLCRFPDPFHYSSVIDHKRLKSAYISRVVREQKEKAPEGADPYFASIHRAPSSSFLKNDNNWLIALSKACSTVSSLLRDEMYGPA